jgi:hypothetical protein
LSSNVRVSAELYQSLREIRLSLESQYSSAAPTVQDLVSIAIERSIRDWYDPEKQSQLLAELLEHRKNARSRMGQRSRDSS